MTFTFDWLECVTNENRNHYLPSIFSMMKVFNALKALMGPHTELVYIRKGMKTKSLSDIIEIGTRANVCCDLFLFVVLTRKRVQLVYNSFAWVIFHEDMVFNVGMVQYFVRYFHGHCFDCDICGGNGFQVNMCKTCGCVVCKMCVKKNFNAKTMECKFTCVASSGVNEKSAQLVKKLVLAK